MQDEERARILTMVAEGVISPEEGADLLEAVRESASSETPIPAIRPIPPIPPMPPMQSVAAVTPEMPESPRSKRVLVIQVREGEGENGEGVNRVNVRIPLGLARAAGKFIPRTAQRVLADHDINLQEFIEEFIDSQEAGPVVQVNEGPNRVLIAVE